MSKSLFFCVIKGNKDAVWIHDLLIYAMKQIHVLHVKQLNPGNTIQKFSQSHVWLDMGLDYNNLHTFINVKGTAEQLELHPSITWSIHLYCVQLYSCILQKR